MSARSLHIISARNLMQMAFKPRAFVVPGILPEGLTILAGKPKIGKSWLAMNLSLAIAKAGSFLGREVSEPHDVLHLALEDAPGRLQHRLSMILGRELPPTPLSFATECPPIDQGGAEAIHGWAKRAQNPRLIVVDVFQRIRAKRNQGDRLYEDDYSAALPLKRIADELGLAVVMVTHTRKGDAGDDPLDQVSGTSGLTGAADNILVLDRNQKGTTLYGRGRDSEEFELALRFDPRTGLWSALGDRAEVERSDSRNAILKVVREAGCDLSPKEIAERSGVDHEVTKKLAVRMVEDGTLTKIGKGRYLPSTPLPFVPPVPSSDPPLPTSSSPQRGEGREHREGSVNSRKGNAGNGGNKYAGVVT